MKLKLFFNTFKKISSVPIQFFKCQVSSLSMLEIKIMKVSTEKCLRAVPLNLIPIAKDFWVAYY